MIELTFRPEREYEPSGDEVVEGVPAAAIEHTYFVVPVRFRVGDVDLLAYPGVYPDWRPLPVLGFASILNSAISELVDGAASAVSLADGGVLTISRDGEIVTVGASLTKVEVTASRVEIVDAASRFLKDACGFAKAAAPDIVRHVAWHSWCKDE